MKYFEPQDGDFQKLAESLVNHSETSAALQKMGHQPQLDQTTALVRENLQSSMQELHEVNANATVTTFAQATAEVAASAQAKARQETIDFTQPPAKKPAQAPLQSSPRAQGISTPAQPGSMPIGSTGNAATNHGMRQVFSAPENRQACKATPSSSAFQPNLNPNPNSNSNPKPAFETQPGTWTWTGTGIGAGPWTIGQDNAFRRQSTSVPRPSQVAHALHQQDMTASQRAHSLHANINNPQTTTNNANLGNANLSFTSGSSINPKNNAQTSNTSSNARINASANSSPNTSANETLARIDEIYRINGINSKKAWNMLFGTVITTIVLSVIVGGVLGEFFHFIITWPFYIVMFFILLFPVAGLMYRNMKLPPHNQAGRQQTGAKAGNQVRRLQPRRQPRG